MELINQTKTRFRTGSEKDGSPIFFNIGEVREFDEKVGKMLLRYDGINTVESLKANVEKTFAKGKAKSTPKAESK